MNSYLLGFRLPRSIDNVICKKSCKTRSFVEEQVKVEAAKRSQIYENLLKQSSFSLK